jgi:hypothetical protein
MKLRSFVLIIFTLIISIVSMDCALFTPKNARTALDMVQITCAIARAAMRDETVAEICKISSDLMPDLRELLSEQRASARRLAAEYRGASCSEDAGPPATSRDGGK